MKKNPFEVEDLRNNLAIENKVDKFKRTYTNSFAEIKNLNTREQWDVLNLRQIKIEIDDPMAFERIKYVEKNIEPNSKILDLGIGSCNLEQALNNKTLFNLTGLDLSPESIIVARKRFPQWKFQTIDITKEEIPGTNYDFIVSLEVFEHISPTKVFSCYKKIFNRLKNGGKLIISVPLNEGLEKMLLQGKNPNSHVRAYTTNILKFELITHGFVIEKIKHLYAFHNYHGIKSAIAKLLPSKFKPNNVIIIARKP